MSRCPPEYLDALVRRQDTDMLARMLADLSYLQRVLKPDRQPEIRAAIAAVESLRYALTFDGRAAAGAPS